MRAIVATDGGDAALVAARGAIELLRPETEVVMVAVVAAQEDPMDDAGGFEGPVITDAEAEDAHREAVNEGSAALARTADAAGPDVRTMLVSSREHPGRAIVEIAEEHHADVVVLGSEQPGFFERIFGRSVADEVVHHAPCPVLVVPHHP